MLDEKQTKTKKETKTKTNENTWLKYYYLVGGLDLGMTWNA